MLRPAPRAAGPGYVYAHHPFDVVGWDGCLYPWAFSIHDFEPITGRLHQPPPVHQTFEGPNFVICSFVPRKVDYHPLAIPVPYNHHNVDSDEMLFYTGGNYEARRGSGIEQGSISLHPSGFTHGPQPGAAERSIGAELLRRAGRHGRHLPPAGPLRRRRSPARTPGTPGPGPGRPWADRPPADRPGTAARETRVARSALISAVSRRRSADGAVNTANSATAVAAMASTSGHGEPTRA